MFGSLLADTFENCHCLWIEIVNHFVMTEKMFVNSPLLAGTVSVGWRQENLDWCKSVKRSGWDRIGGWRWDVPWGERSLRQLQGPCGGLQKKRNINVQGIQTDMYMQHITDQR